ncbi:lipoate--protein ligase [Anaeromassilibacillus senegalensis]|uniref:lipoate--protein ligase n=1 Tax=Anaeromassilibacillus senegalensis TaxID=1673717 RepID=UPI0006824B91|nr:lipoate--protein ligase [Anaeromassilibacillus senegalensis]
MLERLQYVETAGTNPYENLALEEYLLNAVEPGSCMLYLWQNRRTVVIGRNQNCRWECRVEKLEEDGGHLARRLSGGGAVFHDMGNLNFTFLTHRQDYNVDRQLEVILRAVRMLGIDAEKTGRNDLTVNGKKFSGNAFYRSGTRCYHHGTILIDVDTEQMSQYLSVPEEKLQAKGVQSVKGRVVNLKELCPGLTIEKMKTTLYTAFGEVYGHTPDILPLSRIDRAGWGRLTEKFASWEWRIGREPDFSCALKRRFPWGGMEWKLLISGGIVKDAAVYTDAMDVFFAQSLRNALLEKVFSKKDLEKAIRELPVENAEQEQMRRDCGVLLEELK